MSNSHATTTESCSVTDLTLNMRAIPARFFVELGIRQARMVNIVNQGEKTANWVNGSEEIPNVEKCKSDKDTAE